MGCQATMNPGEGCARAIPGNCVGAIFPANCFGGDCDTCFIGEFVAGPGLIATPSTTATIGQMIVKAPYVDPFGEDDVITHMDGKPVRGIGHVLALQSKHEKTITVRRGADRFEMSVGACAVDRIVFKPCTLGGLANLGVTGDDAIEAIDGKRLTSADDILALQLHRASSVTIERAGKRREVTLR